MIKLPVIFTQSSEKTSLSARSFFSILFGLAAILSALNFLHLEKNLNLIDLFVVVAAGFVLYCFLPIVYRLPLLFVLNVVAIFVLLGIREGIVLLVFSLVLFAILNMPLSVRIRTIVLVAAGVLLAMGRILLLPLPYSSVVLPVLGGLFMFRSILFLHEQRFAKKKENIWIRLNYFFLLPNLVFVIFPVVDYKTFVNNYYSKPAYETYRKGVLWMANGVLHLFLYRLIYFYLIPNPSDIQDIYSWLQFIIASYALIVRLAGIFHFSAGIICLFGFDLPPTFNNYFFADSFNDLWRRINMYWRDFVMKVFYYPIYFKVKHWGTIKAIAFSIMITFILNWLLHAYQWFWIRGSLLFTIQDISFWAVFGLAVMLNSVYQAKSGQKKHVHKGFQFSAAILLSLRVIGIFMFMAVIWSWWTTPSITAWFGLLGVWKTITPTDCLLLFGQLTGLVFFGIVIQYIHFAYNQRQVEKRLTDASVYFLSVAGIWILSFIGISFFTTELENHFNINMGPVLYTQLNAADREIQFKGYYETMLAGSNLLASPFEETEEGKPKEWQQLHTLNAMINTNDLVTKKLKPNMDIIFKGARFQTNDLGLRDRPVQINTPANTLRMALLGGSIEMGSGVTTEQTFENLVEDKLTTDHLFEPYQRVEIVNFAVPGTHLPQHLARLDKIVPDFHPKVVIYTAHSDELRRIRANLYRVYSDIPNIEYEYIKTLFANLNLPKEIDEATFNRAIQPNMNDFIVWGLSHIKNKIDSLGAIPVWMFVPTLDGSYTTDEDKQCSHIAEKLGFYILDLHNFNGDIKESEIILRKWDHHPNALGHSLLAKKMYLEIQKNTALIKKIKDSYHSQ